MQERKQLLEERPRAQSENPEPKGRPGALTKKVHRVLCPACRPSVCKLCPLYPLIPEITGHFESFTAEKASLGNTTNIWIFFTVDIAKLKLLTHNQWDFERIMCSGNGQLDLVWNKEIKTNPKLTSYCIIHTRIAYISFRNLGLSP